MKNTKLIADYLCQYNFILFLILVDLLTLKAFHKPVIENPS